MPRRAGCRCRASGADGPPHSPALSGATRSAMALDMLERFINEAAPGLDPSSEDETQEALEAILRAIDDSDRLPDLTADEAALHRVQLRLHLMRDAEHNRVDMPASGRNVLRDIDAIDARPTSAAQDFADDATVAGELFLHVDIVTAVRRATTALLRDADLEERAWTQRAQNPRSVEPADDEDSRAEWYEMISDTKSDAVSENITLTGIEELMGRALASRDREIVMLLAGGLDGEPMSLQDVGDTFGLTRERVRQLRDRAVATLALAILKEPDERRIGLSAEQRERLEGPAVWARSKFNRNLRPKIPTVIWTRTSRATASPEEPSGRLNDADSPELRVGDEAVEMLMIAGRPIRHDVLRRIVAPSFEENEFLSLLRSDIRFRKVEAGDYGLVSSLPNHARLAWREDDRRIETLSKRIVTVLTEAGAPMTAGAILEATGADRSPGSLRNLLSSLPDVDRSDKNLFALTVWGHEPYDTIQHLMARHIERNGGEAEIEDICADLTSRFTISPNSVRTYARSDSFISVGTSRVRNRKNGERVEERHRAIFEVRDCVLIDGRWALRLEVDKKVLTGHSPKVPSAFAHHLGVERRETARLPTDCGNEVTVSRRSLTDNIGRLRSILQTLGLTDGDFVFIIAPDRTAGQLSFRGLFKSHLDEMNTTERVAALLGLVGPLTTAAVAVAVGLRATATATVIGGTLRARGEQRLADELLSVLSGEKSTAGPDAKDIADILGL